MWHDVSYLLQRQGFIHRTNLYKIFASSKDRMVFLASSSCWMQMQAFFFLFFFAADSLSEGRPECHLGERSYENAALIYAFIIVLIANGVTTQALCFHLGCWCFSVHSGSSPLQCSALRGASGTLWLPSFFRCCHLLDMAPLNLCHPLIKRKSDLFSELKKQNKTKTKNKTPHQV